MNPRGLTRRAGMVYPLVAIVFVCASTSCQDQAPAPAPAGSKLAIQVSPLTLQDVTNACYTVTVRNGSGGSAATLWSESICSDAYGDGHGSVSYVGSCDASTGTNTVELTLDGLWAPNELSPETDYLNPCTGEDGSRCVVEAPCYDDQDVSVRFDLTVMRYADQGFFDIAVNFDDIFCSAKVDCAYEDGRPLELLFDEGRRAPTAVLALACSAGPDSADTTMYLDDPEITCVTDGEDGTITKTWTLDASPDELGNQLSPDPASPIYAWAVFTGTEKTAGFEKAFWNTVIGLHDIPADTTCTLSARATASAQPFPDGKTPAGFAWPIIDVSVPLNGTDGALTCATNPLNGDGSGVRTRYTHVGEPGECLGNIGDVHGDVVELGETACGAPGLAWSSGAFGQVFVGDTAKRTLTLTNNGGVPTGALAFGVLAAPFAYDGAFPGAGGTCAQGVSLAAHEACTVVVSYAPTDSVASSAALSATGTVSASAVLSGQGRGPALLAISEAEPYAFGDVAIGGADQQTFVIDNSGDVAATDVRFGPLAAPYSFPGGFPGPGGTCVDGGNIAPGASCTVTVGFEPLAVGTFGDDLDLVYANGIEDVHLLRGLTGVGRQRAMVAVGGGDFGDVVVGETAATLLTVTNNGGMPALGLAWTAPGAPFGYAGGSFPGARGSCVAGGTLGVGASCAIDASFTPAEAGAASGSISVQYADGVVAAATASGALTGNGQTPGELVWSSGEFEPGVVGGSWTRTMTLSNLGDAPASGLDFPQDGAPGGPAIQMQFGAPGSPFGYAGGAFPGTGGTCAQGGTVVGHGHCTIVIAFTPTTAQAVSVDFTVGYGSGLGPETATVTLTAVGLDAAHLVFDGVDPSVLGTVVIGASAEQALTLTNDGEVPASALVIGGLATPWTFGTIADGCVDGGTIEPGASCLVLVAFAPTLDGTADATVDVAYGDGLGGTAHATHGLIGDGRTPADLELAPGDGPLSGDDFGDVVIGTSLARTVTLTNDGHTDATGLAWSGIAAPFAWDGGVYPGAGGTCGTTLVAGASCVVHVRYTPVAQVTSTLDLEVAFHDGLGPSSASLAIDGRGLSAAAVTAGSGTFGDVLVGVSATKAITLTNAGDAAATELVFAPAPTAPFGWAGGAYPGTGGTCGTSIAGHAECTIVLSYAPASAVASALTGFHAAYDGGLGAATAAIGVSGNGRNPAALTIAGVDPYAFGELAIGASATATFTITNGGHVAATGIAAAAPGAPFTFTGGFPGGGNCGATLAAGASCTFKVKFAPLAAGAFAKTVDVAYGNGIGPVHVTRHLSGDGAVPAALAQSGGDFGSVIVGNSTTAIVEIANNGGVPATALTLEAPASPFAFNGGSYPGAAGTCGDVLAPGASCTLDLRFAPTAASSASVTLALSFDDGGGIL